MKAEIIAIGSELLTPFRQDTNSLYLTEQLERLGIPVMQKTVVGDDRERLKAAFGDALRRVELVIGIGGLGPTEDDRTREAVAELLGRKLKREEEVVARMEERFRARGRKMPEVNLRQAMVPDGADWLPNDHGTAPGLWLETDDQRIVLLLPGPPPELKPMFEELCLARLRPRAPKHVFAHKVLKTVGLAESDLEERVAPIYREYTNPETTILAAPGQVEIHLRASGADTAEALRRAEELAERLEQALGDYVFARGPETLEQVVGLYLMMRGATLAVAESCTGGLVAERLTSVPGSSHYFVGGITCYAEKLKAKLVGVSPALLRRKGEVSAEVAAALAQGVRRRTGAVLGLGITGVAGPTGGTPDKPVGTVHLALADAHRVKTEKHRFLGDRERVRWQASQAALELVRRKLLK
ncbi:MAG: competence/damage-inducible protein A [Acidobacteria bacterium RIFCSPHIGHO2_02_FULL_67_57]|nr:MAG: competence/damage-inducible protein A [Acidobacteria bacterium RIFCSPHIGHO2_02_FULL_67_57]